MLPLFQIRFDPEQIHRQLPYPMILNFFFDLQSHLPRFLFGSLLDQVLVHHIQ